VNLKVKQRIDLGREGGRKGRKEGRKTVILIP
jgi:hypothetical protein